MKVTTSNNYKKRKELEFLTKTTKKELKNKEVQITHNIHRSDETPLTIANIYEIYHVAKDMLGHDKFIVKTMNDVGFLSVKGYNTDLRLNTWDDYMRGKVNLNDVDFQEDFYTVQISYFK